MTRRIHLFVALVLYGLVAGIVSSQSVAAQSTDSTRFQTPSGNINCAMYADADSHYASCLVKSATWKNPPKRPADCDLDWEPAEASVGSRKKGTVVTNSVSVGACRGDIGPLCEPGGCSTLAYGKSVKVGRITCSSQKSGVTCVSNQGKRRGFTVARAGYTLIR